jgi:D-glycero-alpha-D-manno-heptose-7-phosphate kinase
LITTKTPLRVSFIGGGTDYPSFFNQTEGIVIGCTVDLNVYVTILQLPLFAREKFRFTYRQTESVNSIDEMQHPVTRELIKHLKWETPVNIATMADVPGSSGLGSSSSFTVGLALALKAFQMQNIGEPNYLAETAVQIERGILREPGGLQDQYHAAYGGFRSYHFNKSGVTIGQKFSSQEQLNQLSKYFTLVSVGQSRNSAQLASLTSRASETDKFKELVTLRDLSRKLATKLQESKSIPATASTLFEAIEQGWSIKQKFHESIAPSSILDAINTGKRAGALTAKLCGAGSSGFVLFGHMPENQQKIIDAFPSQFGFAAEFIDTGSRVILDSRKN